MLTTSQKNAVRAAMEDVATTILCPQFDSFEQNFILGIKPDRTYLTKSDIDAEKRFINLLPHICDAPVIGEETYNDNAELKEAVAAGRIARAWVVDPIDGTTHFVNGNPSFASMVAFVNNNEVLAAWIYYPKLGTWLTAERGGGTQLNGAPVTVVDHALSPNVCCYPINVGDAVLAQQKELLAKAGLETYTHISIAEDVLNMLCGTPKVLLHYNPTLWDQLPTWLVLKEAGGFYERLDGGTFNLGLKPGTGYCAGMTPALVLRARQILGV